MNITIETDRFLIREIRRTDREGMFQLDSAPAAYKYLGNRPVYDREEVATIIEHMLKQYEVNGIGCWAITERTTGNFAGWTGLKYETKLREDLSYYDLAYCLKQEYWEKGIATETAIASLNCGFEEINLSEIGAAAGVENIASNRAPKTLSFTFIETCNDDRAQRNWYKIKREDRSKKNPNL